MKYYLQIRNGVIEQVTLVEDGFAVMSVDPELDIICMGSKKNLLAVASLLGVIDFTLIQNL